MPSLPSYKHLFETSRRVNWNLEDRVGPGKQLDFTRPFPPETFAQTEALAFLAPEERLALNQIRAPRWTFLGSSLGNRNFLAVLANISDEAAARVEQASKSFALH